MSTAEWAEWICERVILLGSIAVIIWLLTGQSIQP
jgi:hypothetical protein